MIVALIPARYQSSRLPGKPLLKFGKYSMIQRVYLQTIKSKLINKTYVLTDDERVKKSIEEVNGNCLMITEECLNGTERLCIALNKHKNLFENVNLIVNVQGDEPFINPNHIDIAINKMLNSKNKSIKCSTLHYLIDKKEDLNDTSIGKLVLNKDDIILYCSRNCIHSNKKKDYNLSNCKYFGHIGLFVFEIDYLRNEYMKDNTPLQLEEDIEWLKIIENGFNVLSSLVDDYEIGVNLPKDYNYLINKYNFKIV